MGKVLETMKNKKKQKKHRTQTQDEELSNEHFFQHLMHEGTPDVNDAANARLKKILDQAVEDFDIHNRIADCLDPVIMKEICDEFMEVVLERLTVDSEKTGLNYNVPSVKQSMEYEFGVMIEDLMAMGPPPGTECIKHEQAEGGPLPEGAYWLPNIRPNRFEENPQKVPPKEKAAPKPTNTNAIAQVEKMEKVAARNPKGVTVELKFLPRHVIPLLGDPTKVREFFEPDPVTGKSQFDPNKRLENDGSTPLHHAIRTKNLDVVKILLENGADVTIPDVVGDNALMTAVKTGDANIINTIWPHRRNLNINHNNVMGQTALHITTEQKWECCLHFLLQNKADPNCQTNSGVTPLMIAASKGDKKTMEELLKAGADILMEDHDGYTCIYKSEQTGQTGSVKYLLGQIPEERRDYFIKQSLEYVTTTPTTEEETNLVTYAFPIMLKCTAIPGFRNAFYGQKVVSKLVTKLEANLQNVDSTNMTSILIFATMVRFADRVDIQFVKQYINCKGPDMTIQIVKYYTEVYKMSEKSSFLAFLPMISLCKLDEGRVWLKKNFLSVSEYINFLKKDCLKAYLGVVSCAAHVQWCFEKETLKNVTLVWHHFHEVMDKIQTEEREKNMIELLQEVDREKERQERKKEKKRLKRQEKLKKEMDSNIDFETINEELKDLNFDDVSIVENLSCTNDNASDEKTTLKRKSKRKSDTVAQKPSIESYFQIDQVLTPANVTNKAATLTPTAETTHVVKPGTSPDQWTKIQTKKHTPKEKEPVKSSKKSQDTPKKKETPSKSAKKNLFKPVPDKDTSIHEIVPETKPMIGKSQAKNWADVAKAVPVAKAIQANEGVHKGTKKSDLTKPVIDFADSDFPVLDETSARSPGKVSSRAEIISSSEKNQVPLNVDVEAHQHTTPIDQQHVLQQQSTNATNNTKVKKEESISERIGDTAQPQNHETHDNETVLDNDDDILLLMQKTQAKSKKRSIQEIKELQMQAFTIFNEVLEHERVSEPFFDPNTPAIYNPESELNKETLDEPSEDTPSWFTDVDSFVDEDQWAEDDNKKTTIQDTKNPTIQAEVVPVPGNTDMQDPAIVECKRSSKSYKKSRILGRCVDIANSLQGQSAQNNNQNDSDHKMCTSGPDGKRTAIIRPLTSDVRHCSSNGHAQHRLDLNIQVPSPKKDDSILYPSDLDGDSVYEDEASRQRADQCDYLEDGFFPSFHRETKLSSDYDRNAVSTFHTMQLLQLQQLNNFYIQQRKAIMTHGSMQQANFIFLASCAGMKNERMDEYLSGRAPTEQPRVVNQTPNEHCLPAHIHGNQNVTKHASKCAETQANSLPPVPVRPNANPGATVPSRLPPPPGSQVPRFNPGDIQSIKAAQDAMSAQLVAQMNSITRMQMESKMKSVRWRQQLWTMRTLPQEKIIKLDKIVIPKDNKDRVAIASPSSGHVILGFLTDGTEVAVKMVDCAQRTFKSEELQHLTSLDASKFFMVDYKAFTLIDGIYYIATELHEYTLGEFLAKQDEHNQDRSLTSHKLVWQFLRGLASLHQQCLMVHGELRPDQLVIDLNGNLKVSGYGLSKNTTRNGPQIPYTDEEKCWLAPEVLLYNQKVSFKSDIWVAGMLVYFILSGGKNPFGEEPCDVIYNIGKQIYVMDYISEEAGHLLSIMLSPNKAERPCSSDTLKHPFFWGDEKRLRFIMIAGSDVLKDLKNGVPMDGSVANSMISIIGSMPCHIKIIKWIPEIEPVVYREMKAFRQYGNNVVELVLFVYNCCNHFEKMSAVAREIIDEPCKYFLQKFPTLFMTVYRAIQMSPRAEKPCYKPFF